MAHNRITRHLLKVELQTAREHSDWYLLWVGRCQDEFDVRRGLFKRFEHRVKRMPG